MLLLILEQNTILSFGAGGHAMHGIKILSTIDEQSHDYDITGR
jgi:hypothetical protein